MNDKTEVLPEVATENQMRVLEENGVTKTGQATDNMVKMIQQLAMNPDLPVDKLQQVMDMQERILDRQALQDFNAAMVRVQKAIPAIKKDMQNSQTNSTYANLDSINQVIKPLYTEEGFSLSFGTDGEVLPGTVRIICTVSHIGGHTKDFTYDAPIDDKGIKGTVNKTSTHARGSAVTYGKRYLTNMIFNLTLTNEDDDGNGANQPTVELLSKKQVLELDTIIADNEINKAAFLKHYGYETLSDIPAGNFASAKGVLLQKAKSSGAK